MNCRQGRLQEQGYSRDTSFRIVEIRSFFLIFPTPSSTFILSVVAHAVPGIWRFSVRSLATNCSKLSKFLVHHRSTIISYAIHGLPLPLKWQNNKMLQNKWENVSPFRILCRGRKFLIQFHFLFFCYVRLSPNIFQRYRFKCCLYKQVTQFSRLTSLPILLKHLHIWLELITPLYNWCWMKDYWTQRWGSAADH